MAEEGPKPQKTLEEKVPEWAKPGSQAPPPWARNETAGDPGASGGIPFPVYLLSSVIVTIAAVGSIFEYANKNPIFGVVFPDNFLYTPILGLFALTGFPTAAFLFVKSISAANKASEDLDRRDGY